MFHSLKKITDKCFLKSSILFLSLLTPGISIGETIENGTHYPNPGIVAFRGSKWVGSDHLYNLTDKIDVVAEIFKPENVDIPVNEDMIRNKVIEIFQQGKIQTAAESASGKPPLPFFHVLLMIYPIEKGYVALCEGRLFEEIKLDRIILDEQTTFQAITWESENLILSPTSEISNQIEKSVIEIANTFVERFTFYKNIRSQIKR